MKSATLLLLIAFSLIGTAWGQVVEHPPIVAEGLNAYQKTGARAAIAVWFKGSPVESDSSVREELASLFAQAESAYGRMSGFDVIRTVAMGTSVRRVYIVIRFEKGPVYATFECYKTPEGWILPNVMCSPRPGEVWPESLVAGR